MLISHACVICSDIYIVCKLDEQRHYRSHSLSGFDNGLTTGTEQWLRPKKGGRTRR